MKMLIIVMALFISLSVNAEVFRCQDSEGKITYQNKPCPDDKGYVVNLDKNTKMTVEEYKKKEQERLEKEFELAKQREAQKPSSSSSYSSPSSNYSSSTYTPSYSSSKTVHVRGYTRKDGTYVRPHTRSSPKRR